MRLIDADQFERHLMFNSSNQEICDDCLQFVTDELMAFSTVDAVPVVRCKDCKYKDTWTKSPKIRDWFWCGVSGLQVVEDMDFCSYGERKENDDA